MKNFQYLFLLATILTLLFLAACSTAQPSPVAETAETNAAYPAPDSGSNEPVPPSTPGTATLTGVLMRNPSNPQPAEKIILALGEVIVSEEGTPMMASFDMKTSPHNLTDASGRFVFTNIPPGQYVLIVDRITDSFMLRDPQTGGDLIFSVTEGQVVDIGELIYSNLPGDRPPSTP